MIDPDDQIDAVERTVARQRVAGDDARTVRVGQRYHTTVADLWDACTSPDRLARWFQPVSGDLRQGGRYQIEGNAGGTIETCDPPHGFTATWEFDGSIAWIEVRVTSDGEGARIELSHTMHVDEHWKLYGPGATGVGWDSALLGLTLHVSAAAAPDPEEVQRWVASDEGRRFITLSSQRWADAAVAAGEDEAWARDAGQRTTDAYTAEPGPDPAG